MSNRNSIPNFIRVDPSQRNLGTTVHDSKRSKGQTKKDIAYTDEFESSNPFLDGSLANTPSIIKDIDDIIQEQYAQKRISKRKLQRYIPWSKVIMYAILAVFLLGTIIVVVVIINLLSQF